MASWYSSICATAPESRRLSLRRPTPPCTIWPRRSGRSSSSPCTGKVRVRGEGLANPNLKTGEIEVVAETLTILSEAKTTPFPIEDETTTSEDLRLKYRYLDLRRPKLQENFRLRHRVNMAVRNYHGQVRILGSRNADSDEVHARRRPRLSGSQPALSRQLLRACRSRRSCSSRFLMISGFERYYQIVRCFRDEDLRADRQPEFTQVDIEMSFPSQEELFPHHRRNDGGGVRVERNPASRRRFRA